MWKKFVPIICQWYESSLTFCVRVSYPAATAAGAKPSPTRSQSLTIPIRPHKETCPIRSVTLIKRPEECKTVNGTSILRFHKFLCLLMLQHRYRTFAYFCPLVNFWRSDQNNWHAITAFAEELVSFKSPHINRNRNRQI